MITTLSRLLQGARRPNVVGRLARTSTSYSVAPSSVLGCTSSNQMNYKSLKRFPSVPAESERSTRLGESDLLVREIRIASTPCDLFKVIKLYHPIMNNRHLSKCFNNLHTMVKEGKADLQTITDASEFKILSARVLKRLQFYDVGQLLQLLSIFNTFKVAPNSSLVQGICESIRTSLKCFKVNQLIFLDTQLAQFKKRGELTTTMEILKSTLPIIFQEKCTSEFDITNLEKTFNALRFAVRTGCSDQTLEFFSSSLTSYCRSISACKAANLLIDIPSTNNEFQDNTSDKFGSSSFREIIHSCMDAITKDPRSIRKVAVQLLVGKLPILGFSERLYDALWALAAEEKWNLSQVTSLAYVSQRAKYFTVDSGKLIRNKLNEENETPTRSVLLSRFIAYLSCHNRLLRLHPPDAEDEDALTKKAACIIAASIEPKWLISSPSHFSKFVRDLAITGVFPKNHLEMLFSPTFQESTLTASKKANPRILKCLLDAEQLVRLNLPEGSTAFRLIPELRSEALHCLDHFALDYTPVKAHLANALGGSQFLAERVVTPFDTRIDLMVAMRRGDYPIAISDNNSTNDDIFQSLPAESKVVAIMLTNKAQLLRGSGLPMMDELVQVELLRAQRMCPVVINLDEWIALMEHEKIPYIMQNIKKALEVGQAYEGCIM
ncbi:uncharacterized protein LOC111263628 isoform X2 [Varroa jacobsoni]|uniref:uncharacterized protein LOC111263628 isoform X2 n=1 Tax=Varroa jacobsoni TaxID=62625 RepID=UPI000BFAAC01|nr:uncharacterized protein LOC111263628 isoform X2 [Varroa jacobsoni]